MKKFYLFLSCILVATFLTAQPSLQYSQNAPEVGDLTEIQFVVPDGLTHLPAGPDVTWVYSQLIDLGPAGTITAVNPSASPSGNLFPGSNVVLNMNDTIYTYALINESGFYYLGTEATTGMYAAAFVYSDTRKFLQYPFTFGDAFTDTYKGTANVLIAEIRVTATSSVTSDAYGTLILPTGTYTDVLRTVTVDSEIDSVFVGGFLTTIINVNRTQYSWYAQSSHGPLFSIEIINTMGETDTVCYYSKTEAGIKSPADDITALNIFPNPADDHIFLEFTPIAGRTYTISIVNQVGQLMISRVVEGESGKQVKKKIDITGLPAGIYFANVSCDCGKQITKKFVIR